ncbi:MAG: hypothetical protein LBQ54_06420 [Planctomycetaceae bacterium]|nr:hypothetical protein [Planctomycetaceae bacterium]
MSKRIRFHVPFHAVLTVMLISLAGLSTVRAETSAIAPLLKENTLFLGRINLKGLDVDAIAQQVVATASAALEDDEDALAETKKEIKTQVAGQKKLAKQALNKFLEAGINEIYVISVIELLEDYPLIVAIPGQTEMDEDVEEQFQEASLDFAGTKDGWAYFVYCASDEEAETFLEAFDELPAEKRPEIDAALKLHSKLPVQFVYTPSAAVTAGLEVLLSSVLEQSESLADIADEEQINTFLKLLPKVEFASLGCDPAALRLSVVTQFDNENSAQKAAAFSKTLLTLLPETLDSEIEEEVSELLLKPILKDLFPQVKKNQLLLEINAKFFEKHGQALALITNAILNGSIFDQGDGEDEEYEEDMDDEEEEDDETDDE